MPRPLLQGRLGINYRRIPIMSIGRDIYIDTRLIISKLETFFPEGALKASDPWGAGFEEILQGWTIDGGFFWRTAGSIPLSAPLLQNEVWVQDRKEGSGGAFNVEALAENRSWCIGQLKVYLGILERMLEDGRQWLMGQESPTLAELHVCWMCDWAINLAGDMQDSSNPTDDLQRALSKESFPAIHEWTQRFRKLANEAETSNLGAGPLEEGSEAEDRVVQKILSSTLTEKADIGINESDVLVKIDGLKAGQKVSVSPSDFGFNHKDQGILVGLSDDEVVIEMKVPGGGNDGMLRLHYPRINFEVVAV
ncbi:uncharacterized protein RCC_09282 [Ramularia collo-cygni]|uniref:DUF7962 domain-containing protein n=1 Tax=Ramularia collo-cygni TaxID=112498 RepID=A0A2D3VP04_9PEZI|nr:uncharacterized protein RCC_09282 [Ramularia collo-cygni]CZT23568.1 uncharacterized protein RCC_09282 [Ramularia collo-cygni]